MKGFLILFALLVLLIGGAVGWQAYQDDDGGKLAAHDFTLERLDTEGTLTLSEQRGKVVVLNFWASWCTPCQEEAPMLREVAEQNKDRDVIFIGLATSDEATAARKFLEAFDVPYPNVWDRDNSVARQGYYVYALPVTAIINRDGFIEQVFFNSPNALELQEAIDAALES